jgi:hypothetical protein
MTLSIRCFDRHDVIASIASKLGCVEDSEGIKVTFLAEQVRAALCSAALVNGSWRFSRAIHSISIASRIQHTVEWLWPQETTFEAASERGSAFGSNAVDMLRRLANVGDISSVGEGYWIPAPLKYLAIPGQESEMLLIGGLPTEVLMAKGQQRLTCAGRARLLPMVLAEKLQLILGGESQTADTWLGLPRESLEAWTRRTIKELSGRMGRQSMDDLGGLEIYAPDVFEKARRPGRWLPASDFPTDGITHRICRPLLTKSQIYDRPYYWVRLSDEGGHRQIDGMSIIDRTILYRLFFGVDQILGTHKKVEVVSKDSLCRLKVPFQLPKPEVNLLDLGWLQSTDTNRRPEYYVFHTGLLPLLAFVLSRLGIALRPLN